MHLETITTYPLVGKVIEHFLHLLDNKEKYFYYHHILECVDTQDEEESYALFSYVSKYFKQDTQQSEEDRLGNGIRYKLTIGNIFVMLLKYHTECPNIIYLLESRLDDCTLVLKSIYRNINVAIAEKEDINRTLDSTISCGDEILPRTLITPKLLL